MLTGSRNSRTVPTNDEALTKWRHVACLFYNNTGLVKYAQRRYQKRVRQAARKEIDSYEEE